MKTINVSFDVSIKSDNEKAEEKIIRNLGIVLQIFARSNDVCVENIINTPVFHRQDFDGFACRGFGCNLSTSCKRYNAWVHNEGRRFIDFCDPETRELYLSVDQKRKET